MKRLINFLSIIEDKVELYLLSFYPMLLILNPKFANNILFAFLIILVSVKIYINKKIRYTRYEFFLVFFVIAILISIYYRNVQIDNGYVLLFRHIRWLLFPFFIGQLDMNRRKLRIILVSTSLGIMGFICRLGEEIYRIKPSDSSIIESLKLSYIWNHRYMSEWNIPQTAMITGGSFFVFYIIAALVSNKKMKSFLYFISFLSIFVLLSTQSRGMFITVLIVSIVLGLLVKIIELRILPIILLTFFMFGYILFSTQGYMKRYENLSNDSSALARIEVYEEAFRLFKNNKLTGIGFEGFFKAQSNKNYKYSKNYGHPHNMALKMLCETGILGFISYYLFMGNILVMLYKNYKENKYCLVGLVITLTLLLYENIETMIIKDISLPYIFFISGISLNQSYTNQHYLD